MIPRKLRAPAWALLAVIVVAWPSHALGPLDGVPFDTPAEAVLLGLIVPALWWLDRSWFERAGARLLVFAVAALKVIAIAGMAQGGLCTRFTAEQPVIGPVDTIQFETTGFLPSWDVRARGACSAVTARPYMSGDEFPAWFVNLLHNTYPLGPRPVRMDTNGFFAPSRAGSFALATDPSMGARVSIDGREVPSPRPGRHEVDLAAGVHTLSVQATLGEGPWLLAPTWNADDLFHTGLVTVEQPGGLDRWARALALTTAALTLLLVAWWSVSAIRSLALPPWALGWSVGMTALLSAFAATGRFDRVGVVLLMAIALAPGIARRARLSDAFLLVGVPWLVMFVVASWGRIGHVSEYTHGDDWLTYQVSAYRIYLFGYWLEAGEKAFFYQPLYRWICGALHMVFGDSSVGEVYWDAACIVTGALLCFSIVQAAGGVRIAYAAATLSLAVVAVGPIWYYIGRGLAEISAGGFAWLAAFWLQRAGRGHLGAAAVAGLFATLAFWCRLNHLLFAAGLVAFALPLATTAHAPVSTIGRLARERLTVALVYEAMLAAGVLLLAWRTWHYGGPFSPLHGTSLGINATGLSLSALPTPAVWKNIRHSLLAMSIANEAFDIRGVPILVGVVAAAAAVCRVPVARRLPLGTSLACVAGMLSAFIAHAHGYPGRFSIHLLPFALALTAGCATIGTAHRHLPPVDRGHIA